MKTLSNRSLFVLLLPAVLLLYGLGWIVFHGIVHRTKVWTISDIHDGGPITVSASDQFAGAIFSLTWKGVEFIDSFDHGRELQSAVQFDGLRECYNPTEAGANADGGGRWSSSRLISLVAHPHQLETRARMAFWLAPGEASPSCAAGARNAAALSDHELAKAVRVSGNVIAHDVTFHVPRRYDRAAFEVVTAYLPDRFDTFWSYDARSDAMIPLSKGPGGHSRPVVISTRDRKFALGVYSQSLPQPEHPNSGYGRQRFKAERVSKWSCVYRLRHVEPGPHTFRCYTIVGSMEDVHVAMRALVYAP